MTDKTIRSLIRQLNKKRANKLIFLRPLSTTVDFAKVWLNEPKPTDAIVGNGAPSRVYFIKNSEGVYIGAVLDMYNDLHWFVTSKYRGKGNLSRSLKETILPHLFQSRKEQRVTIDLNSIGAKSFEASENVAINIGFIKRSNENGVVEYFLARNKIDHSKCLNGQNTEISKERLNELKRKINFISRSLYLIQTEVEMKLGNCEYSNELKQLAEHIQAHTYKIEDRWYESANL